jgi:hypothetical protein
MADDVAGTPNNGSGIAPTGAAGTPGTRGKSVQSLGGRQVPQSVEHDLTSDQQLSLQEANSYTPPEAVSLAKTPEKITSSSLAIGGRGGDGGLGGAGGDVGRGLVGDGGDGGPGGNGGVGGDAAAVIMSGSLLTGAGNDRMGVSATAIGGAGGAGGTGGHGGNGGSLGGDGGDGGAGGLGGSGGSAASLLSSFSLDAGLGHDRISLLAQAVGGRGGEGGNGARAGHGGRGPEGGDDGSSGGGGSGGDGGSASASIEALSVRTGGGNDTLYLHATAIGGAGRGGGRTPGDEHDGSSGSGGDAAAVIRNVWIETGDGDDEITLGLTARVGAGGRGPGPGGAEGSAEFTMIGTTIEAGAGNDIIKLSASTNSSTLADTISNNVLSGGAGRDTLDLKSWFTGVTYDARTDSLDLGSGGSNQVKDIERIIGTDHGDYFVFDGDSGGLTVAGGRGGDGFALSATPQQKPVVITDFDGAVDHFIIDAEAFGLASGSVRLVGNRDKATESCFVYDDKGSNAGFLYFDADGGNHADAVLVAYLSNAHRLQMDDFLLV